MSANGNTSGDTHTSIRAGSTTIQLLGALMLALLLTGCGATTVTTGSTSISTQTTSTTPVATTSATAQTTQSPAPVTDSTSCSSSNQQTADVGQPTTIVTPATPGRAVTAHVGDTVQVRLPATSRWSFQAVSSLAVLSAIAPTNMYSPSLNTCVWTFQAKATGTETLRYGGAPICKPGQLCPAYRIAMDFTVKVS